MDGVDYATVMENSCDPSHANFVHNGLLQAWADAVPMFAKLGTTIDPLEGFRVEHRCGRCTRVSCLCGHSMPLGARVAPSGLADLPRGNVSFLV